MRTLAAVVVGVMLTSSPALAQTSKPTSYSFLDTTKESLFGDVYAELSRWQPLSAGMFFSEGWNRPWASPPPGRGGAPRQGWLNAFDGVFYRLGTESDRTRQEFIVNLAAGYYFTPHNLTPFGDLVFTRIFVLRAESTEP